MSPEVFVVYVGGGIGGIGAAGLAVGGAGYYEAVEIFHRLVGVVAEVLGQPIQELRMRWRLAHFSEVVGGFYYASAEVVVPDSIYYAAPGEGVFWVGDPVGEGGSAAGFIFRVGEFEARFQGGYAGHCAGGGGLDRLADVASSEDVDFSGF